LVRAIQSDDTGRVIRRVQEVVRALSKDDSKAHAFALMLPKLSTRKSGAKRHR
jgi:hypothetical protein